MTAIHAPLTVVGDVDERAIEQMHSCIAAGDATRASLSADAHVGYSQPVGGAVAYADYISVSGVGYDIGCGNKAVLTSLHLEDIQDDLPRIADEIARRISFGIGRNNNEPLGSHGQVIDMIEDASLPEVRRLRAKAANQLGTVGAGNHYVDLFADEHGSVWVGVHFGSRGFGHTIASGFLSLAAGRAFGERARDGEMFSPPVLLHVDSQLGQSYIEAMRLAGEYAYAGRDIVCDKVVEDILGAEAVYSVHNHHNFAWRERHDDTDVWVVRKGCTPAYPGQEGFVGATMGEPSVILSGVVGATPAAEQLQRGLMYSTVHGAGRLMSRTQAAGKMAMRAVCSDRDCDFSMPWKQYRAQTSGLRPDQISFCAAHPRNTALKRRVRTQTGAVDWSQVMVDMNVQGIQLRGGAADEAPAAYKRLPDVLAAHEGTIKVTHTLRPVAVVMAGADTFDPFKD